MRALRHFWHVALTEFKRLAAYRVQFWFEVVVASLVELGIALLVWRSIFAARGGAPIGRYTSDDMVLYVMLATFIGHAIKGTGVGTFGREIYDGSFTRYLILPLSPYSYKYGLYFPRTCIALGQLLVVFGAAFLLGLWPESLNAPPIDWLRFFVTVIFASYLYFLMIVTIETVSFWADHSWAISAMLLMSINLLSGKLIPIDLFPDWARSLIDLSPFPVLVFLPIQTLSGKVSSALWCSGLLKMGLWTLVFYALSRLLIARGIRRYSGVGI